MLQQVMNALRGGGPCSLLLLITRARMPSALASARKNPARVSTSHKASDMSNGCDIFLNAAAPHFAAASMRGFAHFHPLLAFQQSSSAGSFHVFINRGEWLIPPSKNSLSRN
jgi:hypothetical protein